MQIKVEYSDKKVTPWGGMVLMKDLWEQSNARSILETLPLPQPHSNRGYSPVEILETFFVSIWCGASKFFHTEYIRADEALRLLFEWRRVPGSITIGRFFKKFTWALNDRIFPTLFGWFFRHLKYDNYTLDLDSSVLTRYGFQEGSKVGYNPAKRGRKSHHPIMAFISDLRMVVNLWLRPGNTGASSNLFHFLDETMGILAGKKIGLLRGDSGFYGDEIFTYLESASRAISYIIAGRMTPYVKFAIRDHKRWLELAEGIWIGETEFSGWDWGKARRLIIIRQDLKRRPQATGKQIDLFDEAFYYRRYRYTTLITSLDLPAAEVWRLYRSRSDSENRIKELKYDFGFSSFNQRDFWGTEAALRFVMMAYNWMSLFRQYIWSGPIQPRLATLRYQCFAVGSWIIKRGNSSVLKMAVALPNRVWMDGLFSKVRAFEWPVAT